MADKKQDKAEDAAAAVDPEVQDADPTTGDRVAEGESAGESTGETSSDHAADTADAGSSDADLFETLVAERDALKDQLLRALADVENMRRRTERELETARKYGQTGFARDLVGAIDNLALALDASPGEDDVSAESVAALVTGLEMSWTEIQSTMERHGVKRISPLGEKFDYNFHQAMFEMPHADHPPGTVV
ncbi:MAG: nucleotide exchange factor GrpE, partial [Pseudomonadota bacterium]|nr:nucleotide exchange factor GrpE [Pseudomonadota bacterium]